jgi:hypothetical protein
MNIRPIILLCFFVPLAVFSNTDMSLSEGGM